MSKNDKKHSVEKATNVARKTLTGNWQQLVVG